MLNYIRNSSLLNRPSRILRKEKKILKNIPKLLGKRLNYPIKISFKHLNSCFWRVDQAEEGLKALQRIEIREGTPLFSLDL